MTLNHKRFKYGIMSKTIFTDDTAVRAMKEATMIKAQQTDFLSKEIWILTFAGGFQRASVYANGITDLQKSTFRLGVKDKINDLVKNNYKESQVTSQNHINNLIDIQNWVNNNYSQILKNGNINLGVVQKILNLHLKYLWCLGLVKTPPHCPFDRIIIARLRLHNPPAWTKLDSVETYKTLVTKASELAEGKTIAEWELSLFSRRIKNPGKA